MYLSFAGVLKRRAVKLIHVEMIPWTPANILFFIYNNFEELIFIWIEASRSLNQKCQSIARIRVTTIFENQVNIEFIFDILLNSWFSMILFAKEKIQLGSSFQKII